MSNLDWDRLVTDIKRAEVSLDPWKAFIGLVTLRRTEFIAAGACYTIDPSRTYGIGTVAELVHPGGIDQTTLVHPDDCETWTRLMQEATSLQRAPTDNELAAWLFWTVHRRKQ